MLYNYVLDVFFFSPQTGSSEYISLPVFVFIRRLIRRAPTA